MSVVTYKVRMERMSNDRWPKKVYMWNNRKRLWGKKYKRKINESYSVTERSARDG